MASPPPIRDPTPGRTGQTRAGVVVRNFGSGVLAQLWSAALGLIILPIYLRTLDPDRYGLLGLCLILIGVGSVMDLGIGRSLGKFIAEELELGRPAEARRYFLQGVAMAAGLGGVAALAIMATSPWITRYLLRPPATLSHAAEACVIVTAVGLPAMLTRMSLEGLLIGHQHISFLNLNSALVNTIKGVGGATACLLGYRVEAIIAVYVAAAYVGVAVLAWYARAHLLPRDASPWGWRPDVAAKILRLGGLSTACLITGFLLLYVDRFVITAMLPFVWVGYYTADFDITSKQWLISNNVGQSFFPVFSAQAAANPAALVDTYLISTRALSLASTGAAALVAVLSAPILEVWGGPLYATNGAACMAVLSIGLLLTCYVNLPYNVIFAAMGKPEVYVYVYGFAAALHVGLSLWWVKLWGIAGVAAAFSVAYLVVWVLSLHLVRRRLIPVEVRRVVRECYLRPWITAAVVSALAWRYVRPQINGMASLVVGFAAAYAAYLVIGVAWSCDRDERQRLWSACVHGFGLRRIQPAG